MRFANQTQNEHTITTEVGSSETIYVGLLLMTFLELLCTNNVTEDIKVVTPRT